MISVVLLAAFAGLVSATVVQDCGSTATVNMVTIRNCEIPPCFFQRGEDMSVELDLINNVATETLTTSVTANIGGIDIPWAGIDEDSCTGMLEGDCPLAAGEKALYRAEAPVLMEYPSLSLVITWQQLDDTGATTVCFLFPATII